MRHSMWWWNWMGAPPTRRGPAGPMCAGTTPMPQSARSPCGTDGLMSPSAAASPLTRSVPPCTSAGGRAPCGDAARRASFRGDGPAGSGTGRPALGGTGLPPSGASSWTGRCAAGQRGSGGAALEGGGGVAGLAGGGCGGGEPRPDAFQPLRADGGQAFAPFPEFQRLFEGEPAAFQAPDHIRQLIPCLLVRDWGAWVCRVLAVASCHRCQPTGLHGYPPGSVRAEDGAWSGAVLGGRAAAAVQADCTAATTTRAYRRAPCGRGCTPSP